MFIERIWQWADFSSVRIEMYKKLKMFACRVVRTSVPTHSKSSEMYGV